MTPRTRPPHVLGEALGEGGYAEVFRASPRDGAGPVLAFKRAKRNADALARMAREVEVLRHLDHPHVMPLLDTADDASWFVMPLAQGNLDDLATQGALDGDREGAAIAIIDEIGLGLQHAHERGYVHRDVSPTNILRLTDGGLSRWVVSDWGLVRRPAGMTTRRLTETGQGLGTRGFAAPETWSDAHAVDERADVYSLGRVVGWLLTGRWPQQNEELLPLGRLRGLVYEATALSPARRLASMSAMRSRLTELLDDPPVSPRGRLHALIEEPRLTKAAVDVAFDLARAHEDDDEIFLDELARMPRDSVASFSERQPKAAASVARVMLGHLLDGRFGHRDFSQLDDPLGFSFEVLRSLVEQGHEGWAEDVAVEFLRAEAQWDQWKQQRVTIRWLSRLGDTEGKILARAIRRADVRDYYARALTDTRLLSDSLASELGR